MWKMTDAEGNVFIWKTSSAKEIADGVEVTATVKEHSTHEGMGQTVITRPKIGWVVVGGRGLRVPVTTSFDIFAQQCRVCLLKTLTRCVSRATMVGRYIDIP